MFSHPVMSDPLRPHGLQHARPPCPSPSPGVFPSSRSLHRWCRPAISSCDALFSFCPPSFPASGTFPVSRLRIRWPKYRSFSFSVSPSSEYSRLISLKIDWFDLLAVQGIFRSLLQHHSSKASILWHFAFFTVCLSQLYMITGKTIALTLRIFVGRATSLLFSTLSSLSSLSSQEAIVFWLHGCSHRPQWFWSPRRGNVPLLPPFPLLFAMQEWGWMPWC